MRKSGNSCFFGHTVDVKIKNCLQDLRFSHLAPSKSVNSSFLAADPDLYREHTLETFLEELDFTVLVPRN